MSLDVEHANFLLRYMAEIVLGLIVVLLAVLKLLGRRTQAESAKAILTEPAVTRVEMLECQMSITTLVRAEFDKFRGEMRDEMGIIHRRIDEIKQTPS